MPLRVTGRHVKITEEIRDYLDKKMPRITKYGLRDESVDFVFEKQSFRYRVEVRIKDSPIALTANQEDADWSKAVDLLFDKVERQLKKQWEKVRGETRRRAEDAPKRKASTEALLDLEASSSRKSRGRTRANQADEGDAREVPHMLEKLNLRIFPVDDFDVPEMTMEQAAEELFFRDENFLCFQEAREKRLSIIYRRKDGNFALVRPPQHR